MRAVAAASLRSALRMSGRRCSSSARVAIGRPGNGRQLRRRQVDAELVRAFTQQGGDAVALAGLLGLQLRHAGFHRSQAGVGADHIELVADPGVAQAFSDLARLLLVVQVGQGDLFPQLCAAQLAVGVHQLGDHGHLQLVEVGRGGLLVGVGGFQVALDAAEQVQLPGHVQAQVVALAVHSLGGLAGDLSLGQVAAGAAGDGGHGVIAGVIANRPGGPQAGEGHPQFTVALQRFAHQLVESRVIELLPPDAFEACAVEVLLARSAIGGGADVRRSVVGLW